MNTISDHAAGENYLALSFLLFFHPRTLHVRPVLSPVPAVVWIIVTSGFDHPEPADNISRLSCDRFMSFPEEDWCISDQQRLEKENVIMKGYSPILATNFYE